MMEAPPRSGRIGALPTLPIFFKLQGRTVLLAGGSEPAVWKAELLAAAGAQVLVCDPAPCPAMLQLIESWGGAIRLEQRAWRSEDLADAALAIGALEAEDGARLQGAAHRSGVPVNIVDRPALCDFQFGTIVDRSPLLIAISTDGAAPVFGQALRTRIEALLPNTISQWAQAAKIWRTDLQALGLSFTARRQFWKDFSERALDDHGSPPEQEDFLVFRAMAEAAEANKVGRIHCVGLGPGLPDQLTMAAIHALQSADTIIVGQDTSPDLTRFGRREATRVPEPDGDMLSGVVAEMVESGRDIVFASVGAPRRCDRWAGRMLALKAVNVRYDIIDGLNCLTCHAECAARELLSAPP